MTSARISCADGATISAPYSSRPAPDAPQASTKSSIGSGAATVREEAEDMMAWEERIDWSIIQPAIHPRSSELHTNQTHMPLPVPRFSSLEEGHVGG